MTALALARLLKGPACDCEQAAPERVESPYARHPVWRCSTCGRLTEGPSGSARKGFEESLVVRLPESTLKRLEERPNGAQGWARSLILGSLKGAELREAGKWRLVRTTLSASEHKRACQRAGSGKRLSDWVRIVLRAALAEGDNDS